MDTFVVHVLNALLYASVMFLIAGGLSLIYGVMRIVNLAHGNIYAFGAYVTAWVIGSVVANASVPVWLVLLPAGAVATAILGAILEPTLLRPFYKRAEEYQLLVTFGLLMIIDDVIRWLWGPYPLSASVVFENFGSLNIGDTIYPTYNFLVIGVGALIEPTLLRPLYRRSEEYHLLVTFGLLMILEDVMKLLFGRTPLSAGAIMDRMGSIPVGRLMYPTYNLFVVAVGIAAAIGLWAFIYRTKFGVILRATSQDRRMAAALGINVSRVYVQAFAIGCFLAGLGGAVVVPAQAAVLGLGIEVLILAFVVVVIGGLGSLQGALVGALIVAFVRTAGIQFFPEIELAVLYLIAAAVLLVRPTGLFGRA